MSLFAALCLWTMSVATAQTEPSTVPSSDVASTPRAELESAKSVYFAGGHQQALGSLQRLVAVLRTDETVHADILVEALIYQGEIQYVVGDRAASWATFSYVLDLDPEYQISAFLHPAEVVDWFDLVAREVRTERPPADVAPDPLERPPLWTVAPFGIPQLAQGRTGLGVAFATAQVVTGGASIGLHLALRDWKREIADMDLEAGDPRIRRASAVKWGAQVPLTASFYVLWISSAVLGRSAFRSEHASGPEVSLWVQPERSTVGLRLDW